MHQLYLQIGGVDKFVSHVNATLRHKHDQERLNAIVAKIESYDAVESPNDECLRVSFIASMSKKFNLLFFLIVFWNTPLNFPFNIHYLKEIWILR